MPDLSEDVLAPDVVVRRAPTTEAPARPGADGGPPLVGAGDGALWARAEVGSAGVDLGHGSVNAVVREGTVLFDAQGGAGLVIVLRGEVDISVHGELARTARAGEAVSFDATGRVSDPDPVDAAELARDPFISLNLVLDALAGVPLRLPEVPPTPVSTGTGAPPPAGDDGPRRSRSIFGGSRSRS
ncbi:MAG TPA: hypothetical protein VEW93_03805 [Acidimicrobiales bacterium]|nr:hypothetical protein [Acidimicrobiales bacterium]